jgi:hypothetical protein
VAVTDPLHRQREGAGPSLTSLLAIQKQSARSLEWLRALQSPVAGRNAKLRALRRRCGPSAGSGPGRSVIARAFGSSVLDSRIPSDRRLNRFLDPRIRRRRSQPALLILSKFSPNT